MGYFRTFIAVCTSPSALLTLHKTGALRAWLRTLLTAFLCGVIFAVLSAFTIYPRLRECAHFFDRAFGGVRITRAADGNRRRETARIAAEEIPGTVAAERDAGDQQTVRIDGIAVAQILQESI